MANTDKKNDVIENDVFLDITQEVCPFTFVHTKLLIERMRSGQIAEIRLKGKEPLANVPRAIRDQGHHVLSFQAETPGGPPDGPHRLRVRKVSPDPSRSRSGRG